MRPVSLLRVLALAGAFPVGSALPVGSAFAQVGTTQLAPLPPPRPFDLELLATSPMPAIIIPPPAPVVPPASSGGQPQPGPDSPAVAEPEEDHGPEWRQLAPGQKAGAEPDFDPDEKPERPGISTDPGTSLACLPAALKTALDKVSARFGAVKVTSTWRPAWRARRGSYHKNCDAVDFRVPGVRPRLVLDFARALPGIGGNKVYWNGILHIDTGPHRPW
ncbi:hypothetical protein [Bosea sp. Leaf344]|uniref:hypothetical protein n=1 Tax=Bosea sp. Leaf344 TaxID=1736346 RepID=UPI0012E3C71D|nr:hypothetical protein [Bosea sp. Leaf344]